MQPKIVLHLTQDGLQHWRSATRFEFYRRLAEIANRSGVEITQTRALKTKGIVPTELEDGNLNIVHGGSVKGRGWLNASMAYLPGYWHVNPEGTLADSPARRSIFEPESVKPRAARRFYNQLQAQFSNERRSRYWQKTERTELPSGSIAIVLQGRHPYANRQSHMPMEEMIGEVLSISRSEPIVLKPHPLEIDFGMEAIKRLDRHRHRFVITDANIHDVLSAARVVVSVNSSATFEGFMHRKPSILFGRCDFPTLVNTVQKSGEFRSAHDRSMQTDWDYPKMLYWYFKNHTVAVRSRKLEKYLANQIRESGLDPEDFGISVREEGQEDLECASAPKESLNHP